jgi:hypothetical protein
MGMVMIRCPQTARAIPTGIKTDRDSFRRSPVFFGRTRCPICHTDHAWFAREAWVDEPSALARRRSEGALARSSTRLIAMEGDTLAHAVDMADRHEGNDVDHSC